MADRNPPDPAEGIPALLDVMAALRTPVTGCPWDLVQTFETIAPYTIEEAYEVADAIERGDQDDLKEELGDLLLQVVYHARIAEEAGDFRFHDVVVGITEKMIRRHPHVFGGDRVASAAAMTGRWEDIKAAEAALKASRPGNQDSPRRERALDGVALALPSLVRAQKLQKKAARVGFDWDSPLPVLAKIREELSEVEVALEGGDENAVRGEIGDLLFAVTNLARHLKVDAEEGLKATNSKFLRRFSFVEDSLRARGIALADASLEEMDALWNAAKADERQE